MTNFFLNCGDGAMVIAGSAVISGLLIFVLAFFLRKSHLKAYLAVSSVLTLIPLLLSLYYRESGLLLMREALVDVDPSMMESLLAQGTAEAQVCVSSGSYFTLLPFFILILGCVIILARSRTRE